MNNDDFNNRFLEKGRELYEAGKKSELLYCLNHCIQNKLPIPDWLKQAFYSACSDVREYKVKSWDDVFGKPLKKGKRLLTERRKAEIAGSIFERINKRYNAGEPLEELFREVGKDFGVGSTVAKELYYEMGYEITHMEDDDFINRSSFPERLKKTRKVSGKISKQKSR